MIRTMMKYLHLPIHLVEFWFSEGIQFYVRTWRNLMLYLEEDLAVRLMIRLLFTPLFHDSTLTGRILSFLFRVGRILIGLFAFVSATILLFAIAGYWLSLPVLALFDEPQLLSRTIFLSGLGLFLIHITFHPHKKVWQIKNKDFWDASKVKKKDLVFKKLLSNREVLDLLSNLELQLNSFPLFEITDIEKLGKSAFEYAKKTGSIYIGHRHFFVAALLDIPNIENSLLRLDLKIEDFVGALFYLERKKELWRKVWLWDDDFIVHHLKGVNRGWLGVPTPNLDLISLDLTKKMASENFPVVEREHSVIPDVVNILSQTSGRNVILVGPPGSGKSALLKQLAKQIVTGDAPPSLATKRIVLLDLTKLLSGIKNQGELAERIKDIFEEVSYAQNIIIAIEEIHELGMGEVGSSLNLYSLMESYLEADSFQFIATTEPQSYAHILEKNASLARMFRKVELEPATPKDSLNILEYRSIEAERKDKVRITFVAIKTSVELSKKFIHDRVLPDSAISVLKEAMTEAVNGWVTKDVIRRVISSRVKVPMMEVGNVDKQRLLNFEQELHGRLIGQDQAVKAVSDALRRSATGMSDDGRPIGSFLFVGPTGVGKTELAKTLADVYFKTEGAFLRFDMSEYQNPESVNRLIGEVGEGGLLTEAVRNRPYALLLLDEFEKAHEKILTLFLQVLDDGRLTDGAGRTVSFENSIIIATSNVASLTIARGLGSGKTMDEIDKQVNEEILKIFKPELINRFDDVVIFKPLSAGELQKIVQIKLAVLQTQMKDKGFLVEFDNQLINELGQRGFDPVLGARPLRRLIQDTLEAKFSRLILEGKLVKGELFKAGIELLV